MSYFTRLLSAPSRSVPTNDTLVQTEFELTGPTRGSAKMAEAARNPITLHGARSAIASHDTYIKGS